MKKLIKYKSFINENVDNVFIDKDYILRELSWLEENFDKSGRGSDDILFLNAAGGFSEYNFKSNMNIAKGMIRTYKIPVGKNIFNKVASIYNIDADILEELSVRQKNFKDSGYDMYFSITNIVLTAKSVVLEIIVLKEI